MGHVGNTETFTYILGRENIMEHDVTTIIISGLYFLIVSLYILLNPQKWTNYSEFTRLLIAGFVVLFLATVSNSLIEA